MKTELILIRLGARIKALRKFNNLSLEDLAERAFMSSDYLTKIEQGKVDCPIDALLQIANGLGVRLHELF